jgi:hypothetical protein
VSNGRPAGVVLEKTTLFPGKIHLFDGLDGNKNHLILHETTTSLVQTVSH